MTIIEKHIREHDNVEALLGDYGRDALSPALHALIDSIAVEIERTEHRGHAAAANALRGIVVVLLHQQQSLDKLNERIATLENWT